MAADTHTQTDTPTHPCVCVCVCTRRSGDIAENLLTTSFPVNVNCLWLTQVKIKERQNPSLNECALGSLSISSNHKKNSDVLY